MRGDRGRLLVEALEVEQGVDTFRVRIFVLASFTVLSCGAESV